MQANRSNKVVLYYDHLSGGTDGTQVSTSLSVEAARNRFWPVNDLWYTTWTSMITNRLLLEVGQSYRAEDVIYGQDTAGGIGQHSGERHWKRDHVPCARERQ